ncbi:hypothetical protein [Zoogloea sp.]|uniref:hypothetical protein n=1 Tax=Zoogloea sp. TaxID=49181 RepID=UPI00262FC716|nr:hypothetical protein [Zoogloea sp.]MDD3352631.1 hypothetical protein [Zoogloea sp.]
MTTRLTRIDTDYKFYPFKEPTLWTLTSYQFDECKLNLLWLVCPEIDRYHDQPWGGNLIARDIDTYMDRRTRKFMQLPPLDAVEQQDRPGHQGKKTPGHGRIRA